MTHPTCPISPSMLTTVQLPTTLALDLSDRSAEFHVVRGDGVHLAAGNLPLERERLAELFGRWRGARLVIEAGAHSPWVFRLGAECGLQVVLANPRKVELISKSDFKTDKNDAETLACLGRSDVTLLSPIEPRSKQAQLDLSIQRARKALVDVRTALINHVRGVFKSHGHRSPRCSADCFGARTTRELPADLEPALGGVLRQLVSLTKEIKAYDKQLETVAEERYPMTKLFSPITGVGVITALTFATTIDKPDRFKSARRVGPYLGLVQRKHASGGPGPHLRITKAGDHELRRLTVMCANYILSRHGPDCDLKRFGKRLEAKGGDRRAKKKARVAVARKLAVLLLHLWQTGSVYDPFYLAKKRGEPVPV